MSFRYKIVLAILVCLLGAESSFSAVGDTTLLPLVTLKRFPGQPSNIDTVIPFPSNKSFSRITLKLKLECPCAKGLGEWDYTTGYYLRIPTGKVDSLGNMIFENVELARFITPYWGNRPANTNHTWEFDVTDYAFLMKDSVNFRARYDGWTSSALFSIWFEAIEGVPPYEVIGYKKLWDGYFPYGNAKDPISNYLTDKKFLPNPNAEYTKLRIITTGHGGGGTDNAAEFAEKIHSVAINGVDRFEQHLWRNDCGDNPIYPQDGTWPIARAGWCPGDVVQYWDWDITSYLGSGTDSVRIDYNMEPFTNFKYESNPSGYGTTGIVFFCKKATVKNNVTLEAIKAPNNAKHWNRMNPICGNPIVTIRNAGSEKATSVEIEYGVQGSTLATYTWKGNLALNEETDVVLPQIDWTSAFKLTDEQRVFVASIKTVNGSMDENIYRNSIQSTFDVPRKYLPTVEVRVKTNKQAAEQYEWWVRNLDGTEVLHRSEPDDETNYIDTLKLQKGCYEFKFINKAGYGISWWATQGSLGTGSVRLQSATLSNTFSGDFGNTIFQQFTVGDLPKILVARDTIHFGKVALGDSARTTLRIKAANLEGLNVKNITVSALPAAKGFTLVSVTPTIPTGGSVQLNSPDTDFIDVVLQYKALDTMRRAANLRITSNDVLTPEVSIPLVGGVEKIVSVEEYINKAECLVVPQPANDEVRIQFVVPSQAENVSITMVNSLGNTVRTCFNNVAAAGIPYSVIVPTNDIPSGMYHIVIRQGMHTQTLPLVVTH